MPPLRSKKSKQSRARIKRIMQLDEEVGKLASATPVMISKSLECFLQQLIDETCKETRSRGSKKMTAYHLKHMINASETFDFLREIVETIPDPIISEPKTASAGPSKPRKVSGANPNVDEAAGSGPKKRTRKTNNLHSDEIPPLTSVSMSMSGNGYDHQGYAQTHPHGNGQTYQHPPQGYGYEHGHGYPHDEYSHHHHHQQQYVYGQGQRQGQGQGHGEMVPLPTPTPTTGNLPNIGTWKKDFSGTGGTGENGRGLYDDYEEDEDDY
ncbi:uncharacterized protein I303_105727 [Kwoniella dejecticola CBS 10117]|uniref:Transcription factor CBF/NF-Y/archaeal histone domain-containing protein n=1 Tax=Kwoniella dejecticola CBS 10117 TaxID=1296121 RepID=A0AAJ8MJB5_9TREE